MLNNSSVIPCSGSNFLLSSNRKLKAFTIVELLIGMILTGIIVFAGMHFFLNYERLMHIKNKQMETGKETLQFFRFFSKEFELANKVNISGRSITLLTPENNTIYYKLNDDNIVRIVNNVPDTFAIGVGHFEALKDKTTGWDNFVSMQLISSTDTLAVNLSKQYDNADFMNYTTN